MRAACICCALFTIRAGSLQQGHEVQLRGFGLITQSSTPSIDRRGGHSNVPRGRTVMQIGTGDLRGRSKLTINQAHDLIHSGVSGMYSRASAHAHAHRAGSEAEVSLLIKRGRATESDATISSDQLTAAMRAVLRGMSNASDFARATTATVRLHPLTTRLHAKVERSAATLLSRLSNRIQLARRERDFPPGELLELIQGLFKSHEQQVKEAIEALKAASVTWTVRLDQIMDLMEQLMLPTPILQKLEAAAGQRGLCEGFGTFMIDFPAFYTSTLKALDKATEQLDTHLPAAVTSPTTKFEHLSIALLSQVLKAGYAEVAMGMEVVGLMSRSLPALMPLDVRSKCKWEDGL